MEECSNLIPTVPIVYRESISAYLVLYSDYIRSNEHAIEFLQKVQIILANTVTEPLASTIIHHSVLYTHPLRSFAN